MTHCARMCLALALASAVFLSPTAADAQPCFYADFDDDGNPWTLTTGTWDTEALVKFIIEVPPVPPLGDHFYLTIDEGCCNDIDYMAHHGMYVDFFSVDMYPAFVDTFEVLIPTCTYCCPWLIEATFTGDAPMTPGERYFIGEAMAYSVCEPEPTPPCDPPHDVTITFTPDGPECGENEIFMSFWCPGSEVSDETWGYIKGLYRAP